MQGKPKPRQAMGAVWSGWAWLEARQIGRAISNTLTNADEMPRDQNPIFLKAENRFES